MAAGPGGQADLKKVKAAAAGRAKKGARNGQLQYILWGGGSIGIVVLACVWLVINPDRGPFQIPVNDQNLISHVNRNAKTWRAAASSFFKGWTLGDVKLLGGISVSAKGGSVASCMLPNTQVPARFDSREKWPQCFKLPIFDMGNCTASWAVASASALSNRFCISSPDEYRDLILSPQQLLSCDRANRGCAGGDIDTVWDYIQRTGLVSQRCFPYEGDSTVRCNSRCSDEVPLKAAARCVLNSDAAIRREIFLNGPVVAPIVLVDDFLVYRAGLYQETPTSTVMSDQRRQRIIHAVKIIGWGSLEGKPYWLIENSWGEGWGENGYAKVVAGGDPDKREGIVIESFALAGTPASRKLDILEEEEEEQEPGEPDEPDEVDESGELAEPAKPSESDGPDFERDPDSEWSEADPLDDPDSFWSEDQ